MAGHNQPGFKIVFFEKDGEKHARAVPELPDEGRELWEVFWSASRHRVERNPVSPDTLAAWLRMNGKRLSTLEARAFDAMDRQFLTTLSEEIALNDATRKKP